MNQKSLRSTLSQELSKKRKEFRSELNSLEKQVFDLEGKYLDESRDFGNIFSGWDPYLSFHRIKTRSKIINEERLFSLSSVTSPASKRDDIKKSNNNKEDIHFNGSSAKKIRKSKVVSTVENEEGCLQVLCEEEFVDF